MVDKYFMTFVIGCCIWLPWVSCACQDSTLPCPSSPLDAVIDKYSSPPATDYWALVSESDVFRQDVQTLHTAASAGNRDAIKTLLVIYTHTDGAIAENYPDLKPLVLRYPRQAQTIIGGDPRLMRFFGHWIDGTTRTP